MSLSFSAVDLRDYAQALGWVVVPEALADGLFVLNNPAYSQEQLIFAKDENAPDYERSLVLTTQLLAEINRVTPTEIVSRLARVGDDTLSFRLWGNGIEAEKIKLGFVAEALSGAKSLLLATAHSVLSPQFYHPRLSRREAVDFVEAATFGYAAPRSFVFNVSCPLNAVDAQLSLPQLGDGPFTRIVTMATQTALQQIVQSIESDDLGVLKIDEATRGPLVSSNLCSALLEFQDQTLKNALDIDFAWSPALPLLQLKNNSSIRLQKSYFPRIEELQRELRAHEKARKGVFVGFVDRLNGEPGSDNRRFGEVVLNLLFPEDERPIKARVHFSADLYEKANQAHMNVGSYVLISGTLREGRQPRLLELESENDFEVHLPDKNHGQLADRPQERISLED